MIQQNKNNSLFTAVLKQIGCQGKVLHPEGGQALAQAPQGSAYGTKPAGAQEAFGQSYQTHGLIFGCPVWSQGLDSMIFVNPFQVRAFCDSK